MSDELVRLKLAKLQALEEEARRREMFPHLYMHKFYPWSREFFEDWTSRQQVLCSSNQTGKSSTAIKKLIDMAISPHKWREAWPDLPVGAKPSQWWYLYPTKEVASVEFHEKWKPLLPRVPDDDPDYGWKTIRGSHASVSRLSFNTGINIYFKAYKQDVMALQAGSAHLLACFVAGTQVLTPEGERPVEALRVGDSVVTRQGERRVEAAFSREAEVYRLALSNGRTLIGTPDHPVWTKNRGWIPLASLNQDDLLLQPGWLTRSENWLFSKAFNTQETQSTRTHGKETISSRDETRAKQERFTLPYGSLLTDKSREGTSFIIRTSILLTTTYQTLSACLARTTRLFTSALSGKSQRYVSTHASFVQKSSLASLQRSLFPSIAVSPVGAGATSARFHVSAQNAVRNSSDATANGSVASSAQIKCKKLRRETLLVGLAAFHSSLLGRLQHIAVSNASRLKGLGASRIVSPVAIAARALFPIVRQLSSARILAQALPEKPSERVYCLKVSGAPEYFANGILVHNCDEELPVALLPELQMRTSATRGFQIYVFTATIGQQHWKKVVEERTVWPNAKVWQVGLPDCTLYEDGTPSMWTKERIATTIEQCTTQNEVLKRVYGRFVLDDGLAYPQFDPDEHVIDEHPIPESWECYAGLDYGSGGLATSASPAAIVIIAVNPARTQCRVVRCWRGDKVTTTAQDIVDEYMEMSRGLRMVTAFYDYGPGGRDMGNILERMGMPCQPADKGREEGRNTLQMLLRYKALKLYRPLPSSIGEHLQTSKLMEEFATAPHTQVARRGNKTPDDMLDALRYACKRINWDVDGIKEGRGDENRVQVSRMYSIDELRAMGTDSDDGGRNFDDMSVSEEMEFWQECSEI